jgi:hypothetical protein
MQIVNGPLCCDTLYAAPVRMGNSVPQGLFRPVNQIAPKVLRRILISITTLLYIVMCNIILT